MIRCCLVGNDEDRQNTAALTCTVGFDCRIGCLLEALMFAQFLCAHGLIACLGHFLYIALTLFVSEACSAAIEFLGVEVFTGWCGRVDAFDHAIEAHRFFSIDDRTI